MWDLEARMAEEKASVEAHAKELQTRLNEERNSLEEARTAKHAAEEEKEQVTLKLSAALKHLPVLFPDVMTLRIGASGQLCVAAKGGGKDAPPHVKADLGSAISAIREVGFDQLKLSAFDQLKLFAFRAHEKPYGALARFVSVPSSTAQPSHPVF